MNNKDLTKKEGINYTYLCPKCRIKLNIEKEKYPMFCEIGCRNCNCTFSGSLFGYSIIYPSEIV